MGNSCTISYSIDLDHKKCSQVTSLACFDNTDLSKPIPDGGKDGFCHSTCTNTQNSLSTLPTRNALRNLKRPIYAVNISNLNRAVSFQQVTNSQSLEKSVDSSLPSILVRLPFTYGPNINDPQKEKNKEKISGILTNSGNSLIGINENELGEKFQDPKDMKNNFSNKTSLENTIIDDATNVILEDSLKNKESVYPLQEYLSFKDNNFVICPRISDTNLDNQDNNKNGYGIANDNKIENIHKSLEKDLEQKFTLKSTNKEMNEIKLLSITNDIKQQCSPGTSLTPQENQLIYFKNFKESDFISFKNVESLECPFPCDEKTVEDVETVKIQEENTVCIKTVESIIDVTHQNEREDEKVWPQQGVKKRLIESLRLYKKQSVGPISMASPYKTDKSYFSNLKSFILTEGEQSYLDNKLFSGEIQDFTVKGQKFSNHQKFDSKYYFGESLDLSGIPLREPSRRESHEIRGSSIMDRLMETILDENIEYDRSQSKGNRRAQSAPRNINKKDNFSETTPITTADKSKFSPLKSKKSPDVDIDLNARGRFVIKDLKSHNLEEIEKTDIQEAKDLEDEIAKLNETQGNFEEKLHEITKESINVARNEAEEVPNQEKSFVPFQLNSGAGAFISVTELLEVPKEETIIAKHKEKEVMKAEEIQDTPPSSESREKPKTDRTTIIREEIGKIHTELLEKISSITSGLKDPLLTPNKMLGLKEIQSKIQTLKQLDTLIQSNGQNNVEGVVYTQPFDMANQLFSHSTQMDLSKSACFNQITRSNESERSNDKNHAHDTVNTNSAKSKSSETDYQPKIYDVNLADIITNKKANHQFDYKKFSKKLLEVEPRPESLSTRQNFRQEPKQVSVSLASLCKGVDTRKILPTLYQSNENINDAHKSLNYLHHNKHSSSERKPKKVSEILSSSKNNLLERRSDTTFCDLTQRQCLTEKKDNSQEISAQMTKNNISKFHHIIRKLSYPKKNIPAYDHSNLEDLFAACLSSEKDYEKSSRGNTRDSFRDISKARREANVSLRKTISDKIREKTASPDLKRYTNNKKENIEKRDMSLKQSKIFKGHEIPLKGEIERRQEKKLNTENPDIRKNIRKASDHSMERTNSLKRSALEENKRNKDQSFFTKFEPQENFRSKTEGDFCDTLDESVQITALCKDIMTLNQRLEVHNINKKRDTQNKGEKFSVHYFKADSSNAIQGNRGKTNGLIPNMIIETSTCYQRGSSSASKERRSYVYDKNVEDQNYYRMMSNSGYNNISHSKQTIQYKSSFLDNKKRKQSLNLRGEKN